MEKEQMLQEVLEDKNTNQTDQRDALLREVDRLHKRHELAGTVGPDYFEPGMMEYLEQSDGKYDPETGSLYIRFESRGTRYDGRTEQIEKVKVGDRVVITREETNPFNRNNFRLLTAKGRDIGNMPAELCNVIAPLYDEGSLVFQKTEVSFVEPISKRSRHAKQAVLFIELQAEFQIEELPETSKST